MSPVRHRAALGALALFGALFGSSASASPVKTVFVIAMENHNWTQPANEFIGKIQQIYQNPNAPFINSLVNGTAFAVINGSVVDISESGFLRHGLPQRSGHSQRKQSTYSSFGAQLSLGGSRYQLRRVE